MPTQVCTSAHQPGTILLPDPVLALPQAGSPRVLRSKAAGMTAHVAGRDYLTPAGTRLRHPEKGQDSRESLQGGRYHKTQSVFN